jgi:hypothetical protein
MLEALAVKGHLKVSVEHGRLLYALWEGLSPIIHQSAWKGNSPNFVLTEFSEVGSEVRLVASCLWWRARSRCS